MLMKEGARKEMAIRRALPLPQRVLAVEGALPGYRYSQAEILVECRKAFAPLLDKPGRADLFSRVGVESRCLVEPMEYYFSGKNFESRNRDFLRHALALSKRCVRGVLRSSGVKFSDVGHIFSVTTTGLATPSIEAHLVQSLPFFRRVKRTPIFGVGCAGGAVALARAREYLSAYPKETALVLSVELCSLSFLPQEKTMTQIIAAALFGDGAAAVLLCGARSPFAARAALELADSESALFPASLDVMGWEFGEEGMRLVLSPRAPILVERNLGELVLPFLKRHGMTPRDLATLVIHPGSLKILDACEVSLGLPPGSCDPSRKFLRKNANLSSASVFFILREALKQKEPRGTQGLLAALGPGFACEMTLLRWL